MNKNDLPLGFCFALAQNPDAMQIFSNLSGEKQEEFIIRAHNVSSKDEMQALVGELSKGK